MDNPRRIVFFSPNLVEIRSLKRIVTMALKFEIVTSISMLVRLLSGNSKESSGIIVVMTVAIPVTRDIESTPIIFFRLCIFPPYK